MLIDDKTLSASPAFTEIVVVNVFRSLGPQASDARNLKAIVGIGVHQGGMRYGAKPGFKPFPALQRSRCPRFVSPESQLVAKGIRVGKNRVLRLMRAHGLLAPVRQGHPRGDRSHSGRIRTGRPDELWGTDASRFWTKAEGWCWFFGAVDHCASDVVGWHVAKKGDRWAALEPVRQGVRAHMGGFGKAIALGLGLRHDWGSQYRARQFQAEIRWLGIRSTPAYVGEPECNGVAERFMRTLKEECIHLHDFETLEEAREVIGAFIERYNNGWLLQRHGYLTPARARQKLSRRAA